MSMKPLTDEEKFYLTLALTDAYCKFQDTGMKSGIKAIRKVSELLGLGIGD